MVPHEVVNPVVLDSPQVVHEAPPMDEYDQVF